MTIRSWLRRAAVVGSVLAPLGCLAAIPSDAAPAVRVVQVNARYQVSYRHAHFAVEDISAVGPKTAWAYGYRVNAAGFLTRGVVMRYNGHAWATVPYPGQRTFKPNSLTALSPGDVWLLGYQSNGGPYAALHYIHGRWRSFPVPTNTVGSASLVLSDTDIWVAAPSSLPGCGAPLFGPGCTAAAHWNGVRWHYYRVAVSNLSSLAGSSASDIWAAGWDAIHSKRPSSLVRSFVFRWTGSKFRRAHLSIKPTDFVPSVTVDSPRNVWLDLPIPPEPADNCITHWNGRHWKAFLPGNLDCYPVVSDRHRGAWFGGDEHWTGSELILYVPLKGPGGYFLSNSVAPVPRAKYQWVYGGIPLGRRHGVYQITGFIDKRG